MALVHASGYRPRFHDESPWYWPIAPLLAPFDALARFPAPAELSDLYAIRARALDLPPLRFMAQQKKKPRRRRDAPVELGALYEGRIVERGEVPTRLDDWHDLFNALAFVTFPRAKRALHARQYALWRRHIPPGARRLPNARTREQDALALFDEGGIAVAISPALAGDGELAPEALSTALAHGRAAAVPFGHALYEHLVAGLEPPLGTLHAVSVRARADEPAALLDALDAALADSLADETAFLAPSSHKGCSLAALRVQKTLEP